MLNTAMDSSATGRAIVLAAATLLVAMVSGFFVADGRDLDAYQQLDGEKPERVQETALDTLDLPTVEEARQMIVGTWIEDVDGSIDGTKKGAKKWVFTDGGTVRKYRNGELYAEQRYEIVQRYGGMQKPDTVVGYLKFTRSNGSVYHLTLRNLRRGDDPVLYIQYNGPGAAPALFKPPHVFN